MAYPRARSVNAELEQGMADGAHKQVITDRGGEVETGFWDERENLSVKRFGIAEAPVKTLPDGRRVRTAMTIQTRNPETLGY
jgi:hypothetical protein